MPLEEESLSRLAAPDDPAAELELRDDRNALYRAMRGLSPETREAGEFSFREIGEILGRTEVWARVRFYRGKEELMRKLGGKERHG